MIKALLPGGLAERDGRLQSGDHVLQIGDVNLRGYNSEQVASVLRQSGAQVRLVVARPIECSSTDYSSLSSTAPIVPTKLLTDPDLDRSLLQSTAYVPQSFGAGYVTTLHEEPSSQLEIVPAHIEVVAINNAINIESHGGHQLLLSPVDVSSDIFSSTKVGHDSPEYLDSPETETYEVELRKNVYGLGITVAGYVCEEEDLSGIFVKSIIEGSAAEMSEQIQINDRIVAVDGASLSGVTNHQAVEILRNTDIAVKLTLERFLRGRKYEHLQVALDSSKLNGSGGDPSLPPSPSITTLSLCPHRSDADSIITEGADVDAEIASCTTVDSNIFGLLIQDPGLVNGGMGQMSQKSTPTTPVTTNGEFKLDFYHFFK